VNIIIDVVYKKRAMGSICMHVPGENAGAEPSEEGDGHGPAFGADVTGPQRLTDGVITFKADGQNGQH
jgi:hypothetical protein